MMQQLSVDMFLSVDGYGGSESSPGYFGYGGPDLDRWIDVQGNTPHVALFGRKSYEMLDALPESMRDDGWEQMMAPDKIVFSRTLTTTAWPNTRVSADLIGDVQSLKRNSPVPIRTVGSISVARQLTDAGLVDRLRLMVFPLVLGTLGQEPVFAEIGTTGLDLVDSTVLDGRIVLLEYAPTGPEIPRVDA